MSDMPEWRAWAERAHRDLMTPSRKTKNPLISCQAGCGHRTTKNQAKKNGGVCFHCKNPLSGKGTRND